jgi:hypothetical protein
MSENNPYSHPLQESFGVGQYADGTESTPPATPTKTPHTAQTSHFFSPSSNPRALFAQTAGTNVPMMGGTDVAQMHAIMQLQAQMLVRKFKNFQKFSKIFKKNRY